MTEGPKAKSQLFKVGFKLILIGAAISILAVLLEYVFNVNLNPTIQSRGLTVAAVLIVVGFGLLRRVDELG